MRLVPFATEVTRATAHRIYDAIEAADAAGDALILIELDTPGGTPRPRDDRPADARRRRRRSASGSGRRERARLPRASSCFSRRRRRDGPRDAHRGGLGDPGRGQERGGRRRPQEGDEGLRGRSPARSPSIAGATSRRPSRRCCPPRSTPTRPPRTRGSSRSWRATGRSSSRKLDGREVVRFDGTRTRSRSRGRRSSPWIGRAGSGWSSSSRARRSPGPLPRGDRGTLVRVPEPWRLGPGRRRRDGLLLFAIAAQHAPVLAPRPPARAARARMFVLEVKVVSHGLLTAAGVALPGRRDLDDVPRRPSPNCGVPLLVLLPAVLALGAFCALAVRLAAAAQRAPVATGAEGLEGAVGTVERALEPGRDGSSCTASSGTRSASGADVPRGRRVRVEKVESMLLRRPPARRAGLEGGSMFGFELPPAFWSRWSSSSSSWPTRSRSSPSTSAASSSGWAACARWTTARDLLPDPDRRPDGADLPADGRPRRPAAGHHHAGQRLGEGQRGRLLPRHGPATAVVEVENYLYATCQLAQTTLRSRPRAGRARRAALGAREAEPAAAEDPRRAHRPLGDQGLDGRGQAGRPARRDAAGDGQAGRGRAGEAREDHPRRGRVRGGDGAGRGGGDHRPEPGHAPAALPPDADRDRHREELDDRSSRCRSISSRPSSGRGR